MTNEEIITLYARMCSGHERYRNVRTNNLTIAMIGDVSGQFEYLELFSYNRCIARLFINGTPRIVELYSHKFTYVGHNGRRTVSRTTSRHINMTRDALKQRNVNITEVQP